MGPIVLAIPALIILALLVLIYIKEDWTPIVPVRWFTRNIIIPGKHVIGMCKTCNVENK